MSVKDIASIFEQKAKQKTASNSSKRRSSVDNFSLTNHKFYLPNRNNNDLQTIQDEDRKKFDEQYDKLMSVSQISKNINNELNSKQTQSIISLKKRSQSYSHLDKNKGIEEKNKIKIRSQIEPFFNFDLDSKESKNNTKLKENEKFPICKNELEKQENIIKSKFLEKMNQKSNEFDLSVISEKEDLNTSLSFMDQRKENKIKDFILSTIKEAKNLCPGQLVQNTRCLKENKIEYIKERFIKNKKHVQSENKILNDKLKGIEDSDSPNLLETQNIADKSENSEQKKLANKEIESPLSNCETPDLRYSLEQINTNKKEENINQNKIFPSNPKESNKVALKLESLFIEKKDDVETKPSCSENSHEIETKKIINETESELNIKINEDINNQNFQKLTIKNEEWIGNEKDNEKELIKEIQPEPAIPEKDLNEQLKRTLNINKKLDIVNGELNSDFKDTNNLNDNKITCETNYKLSGYPNPQIIQYEETNKLLLSVNFKDNITDIQDLIREKNVTYSECFYTNLFERYLLIIFFTMYEFPLFYKLIKLKRNKIKF